MLLYLNDLSTRGPETWDFFKKRDGGGVAKYMFQSKYTVMAE